jgi:hypothetical protein
MTAIYHPGMAVAVAPGARAAAAGCASLCGNYVFVGSLLPARVAYLTAINALGGRDLRP